MLDELPRRSDTDVVSDLTWHQGSLLPYTSLWSVMHRLVYLNALTAADVRRLGTRQYGYFGMNSLIANYNVISVSLLARRIHEPLAHFQYATLESLSPWTHHLFQVNALRFCRECLSLGFHSVFHCLLAVSRCPIHGGTLEDRCECGRSLSACLQQGMYNHPGQCGYCRRRYLSKESARHPALDPDSTHAFDEVANWMQSSSDRIYMMCVREPWQTSRGEGQVNQALPLWSELAGVPIPQSISNVQQRADALERWSRGGPFRFSNRSANTSRRMQPRYAVFSAMDRYLRHHVVRGQHWISSLAMSCDADYVLACINSYPEARLAWSYLLWLMAVFGVTELRLLRSTCGALSYAHGMNFQGIYSYRGGQDLQQPEREWLEMHSSATFLTAMWKEAYQIGLGAVATQYVAWGVGLLSPNGLFRWCAALTPSAQPVFVAQERCGITLKACALTSTGNHNQGSSVGSGSRVLLSMPDKGLIKDIHGDWVAGLLSRPLPKDTFNIKLHRLFGVHGDLHFVVFGSETQEFVARLVEHPLEARGRRPRGAISALRVAAKQYLATYGTGSPQDDRMQRKGASDRRTGATESGEKSTDAGRPSGILRISSLQWPTALRGLHGKWRQRGKCSYSARDDFEAVQSWIQYVADRSPASTLGVYARCIEKFVFWAVNVRKTALSDIDLDDFRDFSVFLASPPAQWVEKTPFTRASPSWRPFRKGLDRASVRVAVSVVRQMYEDWLAWGYLKANPMAVFSLEHPSKVYQWLTRKDWACIDAALRTLPENPKSHRLRAGVSMLRECAMTVKEAVTLTYQHLQTGRCAEDNCTAVLSSKNHRDRTFMITEPTMALLKIHLRDREKIVADGRLGQYAGVPVEERPLIGALYRCGTRDLNAKIPQRPSDLATRNNATGCIRPSALTGAVKEFMVSVARATGSPPDSGFLARAEHWLLDPSRQSNRRRREILVSKILGNYSNEVVDAPEIELEEEFNIVSSVTPWRERDTT